MTILISTETGGMVTEHFDTSMIPDEPAYWNALGTRITAEALRRRSVIGWLATSRRAWLLAASLACAGAFGASALRRMAVPRVADLPLAAALAPRDRLARALLEPESPPMLTTLPLDEPAGAGAER